jgi:hypothetical protein
MDAGISQIMALLINLTRVQIGRALANIIIIKEKVTLNISLTTVEVTKEAALMDTAETGYQGCKQ